MNTKYPIYFAPLQGYTEDQYRRTHHEKVGGVEAYFTPFIRLEHGELRSKDLRDVMPEHNEGINLVPQLIARDAEEVETVLSQLLPMGYRRIDINMGCPFPLQTRHGRGAALIATPEKLKDVAAAMQAHPEVEFSAKMRLGMEQPTEWEEVIDIINDMPLRMLTVHPRVAKQQYKGEVRMEQFDALLARAKHPVAYNGDVLTVEDIKCLEQTYGDAIHGVMIGRGLLARPWLAKEYAEDYTLNEAAQRRLLHDMHSELQAYYDRIIPGEAQRLQKLRTFWDHSEEVLGRKLWKKLMKAGNMKNYLAAVAEV